MNIFAKLLFTAFADSGLTFANTSRHDPYKNFNYRVTITGKRNFAKAGFSRVTGLQIRSDVIEYREGNDVQLNPRESAGLVRFEPITLERGMSEDVDMWEYLKLNADPSGSARGGIDPNMVNTVKIELLDRDRVVVKEWELQDAWVAEYSIGDLEATGNAVMIERIVLRHNGIKAKSYTRA